MNKLQKARKEINKIDEEMIELFKKRMEVLDDVVDYKVANNMKVLDSLREKEIIDRNIAILDDKSLEEYYRIVFNSILTASKLYQEALMKSMEKKK